MGEKKRPLAIDYRAFTLLVESRNADNSFNQIELNPKYYRLAHSPNCISDVPQPKSVSINHHSKDQNQTVISDKQLHAPSEEPLPKFWTEIDLIFGTYD